MKSIVRDKKHLEFVRTLPCLRCWVYNSQAAHVSAYGDGGMAEKSGDDRVLPLCHSCHALQHRIGEKAFYKDTYKAMKLSKNLYLFSGDSYNALMLMLDARNEVINAIHN